MKRLKSRILIMFLGAAAVLALCTAMPKLSVWAKNEDEGIRFSASYKKPGDTLVVENAPEGSKYKWTVKSQITGRNAHSETNETGMLQTSEKYEECMITCQVGTEKLYMYCSSLPVMYINSETEYYGVAKDYYNDATVKLVGNEQYNDESLWYEGTAEIKLRGNSTAYRDKRPFRLKLESKADLLGLGAEDDGTSYKSKHWVLLANDIDHSLMRNKLLYDFSGAIGTEFYFHSDNVVLIYNGEYQGVYQLCEHRRVDEGRIDITDWMAAGEDAVKEIAKAEYAKLGFEKKSDLQDVLEALLYQDYSWMDTGSLAYGDSTYKFKDYGVELPSADGGYLAEMDFYSIGSPTLATMTTAYGQPLYFSEPEAGADAEDSLAAVSTFKKTKLYDFAQNYTQVFEYALHSPDFTFKSGNHSALVSLSAWDSLFSQEEGWTSPTIPVEYRDEEHEGKHYSELFDMDSLVTNFIFVEYAMNWDSMKNSFFYYKETGEPAKIGPQWDFDWAWGNTNMYSIYTYYPTEWHTTIEDFTREQPYQSYNWNRLLVKDPYFLVRAYEKYHEIRPLIEDMIKDGGTIDSYHEYLQKAGQANDTRWKYTYNRRYYGGTTPEKFDASVKTIKKFLTTRVEWFDKQFETIETFIESLGYYENASDIEVTIDIAEDKNTVMAEITNPDCKKVIFQINGTYKSEMEVDGTKAVFDIPEEILIKDGRTNNVVVAYEADAEGDFIMNTSLKPSGNYEYIAKSDYVLFTKEEAQPTVTPAPQPTLISEAESTGAATLTNTPVVTISAEANTQAAGTQKTGQAKIVISGCIAVTVVIIIAGFYIKKKGGHKDV